MTKQTAIDFFSKTNEAFTRKLPNVEVNACANCPEAIWRENSKKGPTCFCPVSNEYTYVLDNDTLYEQVLQCSRSQLGRENDTATE